MFKKGARKQEERVNSGSEEETIQADNIKIEFKRGKKSKKDQDVPVLKQSLETEDKERSKTVVEKKNAQQPDVDVDYVDKKKPDRKDGK
jgi:hypothetical protein